MKKFVSRFIVSAAALMLPLLASAQVGNASALLGTAYSEVSGVVGIIINIAFLIIGIVGLVMLIPNLMKYLKGDPSSNDALMKVGAGIVIVVIIAQVIRMVFLQGA
jgi:formate-dependent nitrite reductase membrane component NrfD